MVFGGGGCVVCGGGDFVFGGVVVFEEGVFVVF